MEDEDETDGGYPYGGDDGDRAFGLADVPPGVVPVEGLSKPAMYVKATGKEKLLIAREIYAIKNARKELARVGREVDEEALAIERAAVDGLTVKGAVDLLGKSWAVGLLLRELNVTPLRFQHHYTHRRQILELLLQVTGNINPISPAVNYTQVLINEIGARRLDKRPVIDAGQAAP